MKCTISLPDEQIEKLLGDITDVEFAKFCKEAVMSKLFESQCLNDATFRRLHSTLIGRPIT